MNQRVLEKEPAVRMPAAELTVDFYRSVGQLIGSNAMQKIPFPLDEHGCISADWRTWLVDDRLSDTVLNYDGDIRTVKAPINPPGKLLYDPEENEWVAEDDTSAIGRIAVSYTHLTLPTTSRV